jgi:hypothetical protein
MTYDDSNDTPYGLHASRDHLCVNNAILNFEKQSLQPTRCVASKYYRSKK